MKKIKLSLTAALAAMFALTSIPSETRAADLTLNGDGSYKLGTQIRYSYTGRQQSGRYGNFGADNYHTATIGIEWITNRSGNRSGSMSFELWAMPYYGATSGVVLMTRGLSPLGGGNIRQPVNADGYAIFLNRYRFPELNLWEYTRSGWRNRDYLTFNRKNLL